MGPIEALRGALQATRGNGQPDWPTIVSAAKALAALRPDELEPKTKEQPTEPSIVVYDLPPGAAPVLHRAREGAGVPASNADAPSAQHPTSSSYHTFSYEPPDGDKVEIGMWYPPDRGQSALGAMFVVHTTNESEVAERWRAELSGRLPETGEDVP